ncbi:phage virion morphogenesis protein [Alkalilimnicola sp. S0819]|uniref:phage virion morphogenesis protein n=1 Tax=Alkalilimnicola sp. S0819 TaxID=2613922 RepID=UPI001261DB2F|nr:phage virion morphogenesis protein [Alkalilimnicola sp. S0819]KAB7624324.1 phage virion morphogenesis protein [Alkalilimnicola sp. S0819]MPQ16149.1 phage virion morphogenesis protein [Alkalilimnicola sp. S0819]
MAGTALKFDLNQLRSLDKRLEKLGDLDREGLLEGLGAEGESQTRRRIQEEKRGPDGAAWPDWSARYAGTRHGGHSLLLGEGDLLDSIQSRVSGGRVEWGSNLVYAAIHQFGGAGVGSNIPERAYLGISSANEEDLDAVVDDWLRTQEGGL